MSPLERALEAVSGFMLLVVLPAGVVVAVLDWIGVIDLPG